MFKNIFQIVDMLGTPNGARDESKISNTRLKVSKMAFIPSTLSLSMDFCKRPSLEIEFFAFQGYLDRLLTVVLRCSRVSLGSGRGFWGLTGNQTFFFQASNLTVVLKSKEEKSSRVPLHFRPDTQFLVFHRHVGCEKVETKRDQQF